MVYGKKNGRVNIIHTVYNNLEQACSFMSEAQLQKISESYQVGGLAVISVGAYEAGKIVEVGQKSLAEKQNLKLEVNR